MKLRAAKYLKQQSGYTLVEVLLVLMLMLLVVGVITMTYFTSTKASQQVISASTAERVARVTMYNITRELRETEQIIRAESGYITFLSDINSDSVPEEVNYYLQSEDESLTFTSLLMTENLDG
ncbi:MAG: prepilin-type N-terminal cleavage/methylation domain-containing protein [Actinomycetota bacterium]|nr:prepilin-type N-terminal cleavage/methylation domain-containing protein [Actinomycetota bacterium]